jgi:ABC-2 type transport system permease protein
MMSMLGGAWFPTSMMPKAVQTVSLIIPVRWAVDGIDAIMTRGSGLAGILLPVACLMGFTVVFTGVALTRLSKI